MTLVGRDPLKSACVFLSTQFLYHFAAHPKNLGNTFDFIVLLEITSFSNVHNQEKVYSFD